MALKINENVKIGPLIPLNPYLTTDISSLALFLGKSFGKRIGIDVRHNLSENYDA